MTENLEIGAKFKYGNKRYTVVSKFNDNGDTFYVCKLKKSARTIEDNNDCFTLLHDGKPKEGENIVYEYSHIFWINNGELYEHI